MDLCSPALQRDPWHWQAAPPCRCPLLGLPHCPLSAWLWRRTGVWTATAEGRREERTQWDLTYSITDNHIALWRGFLLFSLCLFVPMTFCHTFLLVLGWFLGFSSVVGFCSWVLDAELSSVGAKGLGWPESSATIHNRHFMIIHPPVAQKQ